MAFFHVFAFLHKIMDVIFYRRVTRMKIYTGFGDDGKTALFGGAVVPKSDSRVDLYGTLDELNSVLGFAKRGCVFYF
jgi:hypothetical protein